jgi:hypothetical protein
MPMYTSYAAGSGQFGVCAQCHKHPTKEGHDGYLGILPDLIMNACCGHGEERMAYIQFWDGTRIAGRTAIEEQRRLLKARR